MISRKSTYLYNRLQIAQRETRQTDGKTLIDIRRLKTATATRNFVPRSIEEWNKLPAHLRKIIVVKHFKKELRAYVRENMPVK